MGDVVGGKLDLYRIDVNRVRVAKVCPSLNPRVEDDTLFHSLLVQEAAQGNQCQLTINVGMGIHDVCCEVRNGIQLGNIEWHCLTLVMSMFLHQVFEILLSTSDSNDKRAIID